MVICGSSKSKLIHLLQVFRPRSSKERNIMVFSYNWDLGAPLLWQERKERNSFEGAQLCLVWEMSRGKTTSLTTLHKETPPPPIILHPFSLLISSHHLSQTVIILFIHLFTVWWIFTLLECKFHKGPCLSWPEVLAQPSTHICLMTERWSQGGHSLMMSESPFSPMSYGSRTLHIHFS